MIPIMQPKLIFFSAYLSFSSLLFAAPSAEQLEKAKPLFEKAEAADQNGDHYTAFHYYLRVHALLNIYQSESLCIMSAYHTVDFARVEKGLPLSAKTREVLIASPEPVLSREYGGSTLLCYILSQIALACDYNNKQEFVNAANCLAVSEAYLEFANKQGEDEDAVYRKALKQLNPLIVDAQKTVKSNMGVEKFIAVMKSAKMALQAGKSAKAAVVQNEEDKLDEETKRFLALHKGKKIAFQIVSIGGDKLLGVSVLLKDAESGKKFSIQYASGLNKGLADDGKLLQAGDTLEVQFDDVGNPTTVKNPKNGHSLRISGYKVKGYGW